MSVQTLVNAQINSVDISCVVSGDLTGTTSVNFKRFNNIVYLSLPTFSGTSGGTATLTYTPSSSVPTQFTPASGIVRFITVSSGGNPVSGVISIPANFSAFTITLAAGGNFAGTSGMANNTVMWNASN
jgi:hypothetical protein